MSSRGRSGRIGLLLLVAAAVLPLLAGCGRPGGLQVASPSPPAARTLLHTYVVDAATVGVPPVDGDCFYASLADPSRIDAWRCTAVNALYDPCFQAVGGEPGVVYCVNDPRATPQPVRLTGPLPARPARHAADQPWALQLAGGQLCVSVGGGTATTAAGALVSYLCGAQGAAGDVTGTPDARSPQWQVTFVPPGGTPRPVAVTDAWR